MSKKLRKTFLPLLMAAGCLLTVGAVSINHDSPKGGVNDTILTPEQNNHQVPGVKLASVPLRAAESDVALGVSLTLTDDILVNISLDGKYENVKLYATLGNGSEQIFEPTVTETGYAWVYKGITPQNLATNLTLKVIADVEGTSTAIVSKDFSVKAYCDAVLSMGKDDSHTEEQWTKMRRAVVNLLRYGGAAERYLGITENNVDDFLDTTLIEDATYIDRNAKTKIEGNASDGLTWYSGNLWFDYKVAVDVKFKAIEGIEGVEVVATINGRESTLTINEVAGEENAYTVRLNEIGVLEYNDAIIFEFKKNGSKVSQTLTYSVNSYAANLKDDDKIKELVNAIYGYGKATTLYQLSKGDTVITYEVVDGKVVATADEYVLEEVTLDATVCELTDLTPIASVHELDNNSYTAGKANLSYVGEYGTVVYKENVALDDMLRFGDTTYYEAEGQLFRVGDEIEGVEVTLLENEFNVTLTDANLTSGIEVWNKSVNFNLVGNSTLSGIAVTETGTHTVGSTSGIQEKLPYALYVAAPTVEGTTVDFLGEGSLTSQGGAKLYTNTTVTDSTLTFNVDSKTNEADGVVGDLESEGLNVKVGSLTANNANLFVVGAETTDNDKAGFTLNSALFTDTKIVSQNFGYGFWINGGVTVNQTYPSITSGVTSTVDILGAKRIGIGSGGPRFYMADGDMFIDAANAFNNDSIYANGEYTKFTLSAATTTTGIVNAEYCDEYNYYGKEEATVYISWKKNTESSWIEMYSETGKFQMRSWGSSAETGGWWGTVNGRVDCINVTENNDEKMALYIIYSETNFSFNHGLWKGNYIHTDAEGNVTFLKYKFRQDANHNWVSSEVTRGLTDARLSDGTYSTGYGYGGGVDLYYNDVHFHAPFAWQSVMLTV